MCPRRYCTMSDSVHQHYAWVCCHYFPLSLLQHPNCSSREEPQGRSYHLSRPQKERSCTGNANPGSLPFRSVWILYLSTMLYYTRQGFYYTHVRAVQSAATHFTFALQTPVIYGFIIWILLPWWGAPWTGTQPTAGPVWYTLLWPICLGKKAFLSKVYRKCQEVQLSLGVSSFFDTPDFHTV